MDDSVTQPSDWYDSVPRPTSPDPIPLDPQGDVILRVKSPDGSTARKFLVSSVVLRLSSKVFARMFESDFREGVELRKGGCPTVSLEEDDPDAMETVLGLLHHRSDWEPNTLSPRALAVIAVHCDKYDCDHALKSMVHDWFYYKDLDATSTAEDYGYMFLAAHLFQSSSFAHISKKATENLAPGFGSEWQKHEMLTRVPEWLESKFLAVRVRADDNRFDVQEP